MKKHVCAALALLATGFLAATSAPGQTPASPATSNPAADDLTVWPNKVSKANSDAWLVRNHEKLRKMRPRVLVLNFCNGFEPEKAEKMAKRLAAAVTEGTRYHGYK